MQKVVFLIVIGSALLALALGGWTVKRLRRTRRPRLAYA
jgi:hypothetical protein